MKAQILASPPAGMAFGACGVDVKFREFGGFRFRGLGFKGLGFGFLSAGERERERLWIQEGFRVIGVQGAGSGLYRALRVSEA